MARGMPRIFRPRRKFGSRGKRRWTAQLLDGSTLSTTALGASAILTTADYAQNANLEPEGPTLVRIRGDFWFEATVATAFSVYAMVFVADSDSGLSTGGHGDPSVFQNLIDDNILWWQSFRCPARTLATHPNGMQRLEIDIKAKRRLKDDSVWLTAIAANAGAAGTQGTFGFTARALLVGNSAT